MFEIGLKVFRHGIIRDHLLTSFAPPPPTRWAFITKAVGSQVFVFLAFYKDEVFRFCGKTVWMSNVFYVLRKFSTLLKFSAPESHKNVTINKEAEQKAGLNNIL